jgi:purine nucleoside phosphorylase
VINHLRQLDAWCAAAHVSNLFEVKNIIPRFPLDSDRPRVGLILGTGWGDAIALDPRFEIPLRELPGFKALRDLQEIKGHARRLQVATISDQEVVAMLGRIHLNEGPCDPNVVRMARLQVEMLLHCGVQCLIVTAAVGSLSEEYNVGDIAVIDGLLTLFAPDPPLWGGEFCSPEDSFDPHLIETALSEHGNLVAKRAVHAMLRGPQFESRRYDKPVLRKARAGVVGMSILPEACIANLYGIPVLALGFVTNDPTEEHSHETNQERMRRRAPELGNYLARIIARI